MKLWIRQKRGQRFSLVITILCLILIILGINFRFTNLDQKPYWEDETLSALRANGYKTDSLPTELLRDKIIDRDTLLQLQRPNPDKNLSDTISALVSHPEHPPLYYLLLRSWVLKFGSSIKNMRSLSVIISLLVFPALYWLCKELFANYSQSSLVAQTAVALTAISPIWIRYAQEVRQYSLWTVMIIVCSTVLLTSLKSNRWYQWLIYSLTLALSLYTHLLSILVLIAHGLYILIINRKLLHKYIYALIGSLILFSPWLWVLISHYQLTTGMVSWLNQPMSWVSLSKAWGLNLSRIFLSWSPEYNSFLVYLALPIVAIIVYALYFLKQTTQLKTWLFVWILIAVNSLTLLLQDLLFGGQCSRIPQYFFPCYIGIEIAIAYLFVAKLNRTDQSWQRSFWQILIALIIFSNIFSSQFNAQADTWWGWSVYDIESAKIINQVSEPLVIFDGRLSMFLPLVHKLNPETKLIWLQQPQSLDQTSLVQSIFVYNPSEKLLSYLQHKPQFQLDLVYQFQDLALKVNLYKLQISELFPTTLRIYNHSLSIMLLLLLL